MHGLVDQGLHGRCVCHVERAARAVPGPVADAAVCAAAPVEVGADDVVPARDQGPGQGGADAGAGAGDDRRLDRRSGVDAGYSAHSLFQPSTSSAPARAAGPV